MGGGSIPAFGAARVRLNTAAAALAVATILAVGPAVVGGDRAGFLWVLATVGLVAAVIALAGLAGATWWSVIALGAEYAALRFGRGPVDIVAAYVAAGLLLLAELVLWSLDARAPVVDGADATRHRLIEVVALSLGSLVLGSTVVWAGRVGHGGGLLQVNVAVAGAIGVLAIVAWASVVRVSRRR